MARSPPPCFRISSLCTTEQTGRVTSVGGNRYTGCVYNEQFNERGNVVLTQRGPSLSVTVSGPGIGEPLTIEKLACPSAFADPPGEIGDRRTLHQKLDAEKHAEQDLGSHREIGPQIDGE